MIVASPSGVEAGLTNQIVRAMELRDLSLAGNLATKLAMLERTSEWYPAEAHAQPAGSTDTQLSLPKLRHDIDQFRYLQKIGVLDERFDEVIRAYESTATRLDGLGNDARVPLTAEDRSGVGRAYGRIVHLRDAPRLQTALSHSWSRDVEAQRKYRSVPASSSSITSFSDAALDLLYRFCLESTVWFGNRYAHGRLGAFFFSGFNCPLLLQLAEELRDSIPYLIGSRYPLRQLWGFKNTCELPADSTIHADFAAINVNCWITPTSANLDESSGGMVIYDVAAPQSWDFATYNERIDLIREFLSQRRARAIRVPYRQNRAIIFNSDLFHATEAVRFKPDYESHRINITLLTVNASGTVTTRRHPTTPI